MNIGIDARNLKDKGSGLVNYVRQLLLHLDRIPDFRLTVFANNTYADYVKSLLSPRKSSVVSVPYRAGFLDPRNLLYETTMFPAVIRRSKPDIFHNPFGFGLPGGLPCPSVLTVHDLIPLTGFDRLTFIQTAVFRRSFGKSVKNADMIVTISDFTRKELLNFYPHLETKKIRTIHNGADDLVQVSRDEKRFAGYRKNLNIKDQYILYIGSATPRKNLLNLVKAFGLLKGKLNLPYSLVIVSKFDRPETMTTKKEILSVAENYSISDRLLFPGYISDETKVDLLTHASVFVYPSIYEGFGLPVLEAASQGVPVVCSDIPVFREITSGTAVYFDPFDPKSISEKIHFALSDATVRDKLLPKALVNMQRFTWQAMTEAYTKVYRSLENHGDGPRLSSQNAPDFIQFDQHL